MNSKIKNFVKTLLFFIGSLTSKKGGRLTVYYHDVHSSPEMQYTDMSTPISDIAHHISIIKSMGFDIVREFSGNDQEIRIAFDDGFRGIYDNKEYFIKNNIPITIFVATSLIGQNGYLTECELQDLENTGFNIQSHGVRHTDMSLMSDDILKDDLYQSKIILETLLGKNVEEICFPIGYFSDKVLQMAEDCGYNSLFSSMPNPTAFPKALKGRLLFQGLNAIQIKLALKGGMNILQSHYQNLHYRKKTNATA